MDNIAPKLILALRRLDRFTSGPTVDSVNNQVHNLGTTAAQFPNSPPAELSYWKDYYENNYKDKKSSKSKNTYSNLTQKNKLTDSERNSLRKLKQIKPTQ